MSPRYESQYMEMIRQLDRAPEQVLIEVMVVQVQLDDRFELGIEFAWQDLAFSEKEQLQLSRIIAETLSRLDDENIAGAAAALDGYWPQFLKRHVDPLEQNLVDTPRRSDPPPRDDPPPTDPPLRQSFLNRARGWWPF